MATAQFNAETSASGEFVRQPNRFTDRITSDGSSGWSVEPGRYRLVVSVAGPWAHRSIIVRELLGLQDAISLAIVDPIRDERGWRFRLATRRYLLSDQLTEADIRLFTTLVRFEGWEITPETGRGPQ